MGLNLVFFSIFDNENRDNGTLLKYCGETVIRDESNRNFVLNKGIIYYS